MDLRKNMIKHIFFMGLILALSGCVYTHIQRPLDTNYDNTELGQKEGRSNAYSILWIIAWGNAGTKAAASNGNIKIIRHADTEVKSFCLGIYSRVTTVVYGD